MFAESAAWLDRLVLYGPTNGLGSTQPSSLGDLAMILSTAFSLILGLNIAPAAGVHTTPQPPATAHHCHVGPSKPISLVAGDEFGIAMFGSQPAPMPRKLLARMAVAQAAPASWTVMPGENSVHLATTH
jgi:hypothetical protein